MGQSWKVVNLDREQALGYWGKLGEVLCWGPPAALNARLTALRIPPIDEVVRVYPDSKAAPIPEDEMTDMEYHAARFRWQERKEQSSRLLDLPEDILREILGHLHGLAPVLLVSCTCQALWSLGRHFVYARIVSRARSRSWQGDRLICVGAYLQEEDIPAGLLSPEEHQRFLSPHEDEDGETRATLYSYPFREVRSNPGAPGISRWIEEGAHLYRHAAWAVRDLLPALVDLHRDFYDERQVRENPAAFVLRNLTKREYVRGAALAELHAKYAGTSLSVPMGRLTLAEVVFPRICLSSDPSMSLAYEPYWSGKQSDLHRGEWAGDCFDVVWVEDGLEWMDGVEKAGKVWKDVSGEVLDLVEKIWVAEFK
ncbi:hypothetical protein HMN09_00210000 [Mycena chlorophos]|uniref:F-box domain-containing protein n=1 Tax=Mycena chlorophos TaxID=658473 RepID=A0A8H6WKX9_MYCCL|nr:hypothetical protein HMN09_00210000 [Mycena chlorophos]